MIDGNSSVTQIPIQFRVTLTLTTKIRPKRNPFLERKPLTIRLDLTFATDLTFCCLCFPHPSVTPLRASTEPARCRETQIQPRRAAPLSQPRGPLRAAPRRRRALQAPLALRARTRSAATAARSTFRHFAATTLPTPSSFAEAALSFAARTRNPAAPQQFPDARAQMSKWRAMRPFPCAPWPAAIPPPFSGPPFHGQFLTAGSNNKVAEDNGRLSKGQKRILNALHGLRTFGIGQPSREVAKTASGCAHQLPGWASALSGINQNARNLVNVGGVDTGTMSITDVGVDRVLKDRGANTPARTQKQFVDACGQHIRDHISHAARACHVQCTSIFQHLRGNKVSVDTDSLRAELNAEAGRATGFMGNLARLNRANNAPSQRHPPLLCIEQTQAGEWQLAGICCPLGRPHAGGFWSKVPPCHTSVSSFPMEVGTRHVAACPRLPL